MATEHFDIGYLLPGGGGDIQSTYSVAVGGKVLFLRDKYLGMQFYKLCQNRSGSAQTQGELASLPGGNSGVTSITNLDSGTTTSATKASGFTADLHEGAVAWIMDNADTAGTAPECEMAGIKTNTASVLTFDPGFPLSVALAVNDDVDITYTYQVEDAAANDTTTTVQGVVAAKDGVADKSFGWYQFFGRCRALTISAAYAIDDILVAGAARLALVAATDTGRVIVAKSLSTIKADSASDYAMVFLNCGDHSFGNISTLDITA